MDQAEAGSRRESQSDLTEESISVEARVKCLRALRRGIVHGYEKRFGREFSADVERLREMAGVSGSGSADPASASRRALADLQRVVREQCENLYSESCGRTGGEGQMESYMNLDRPYDAFEKGFEDMSEEPPETPYLEDSSSGSSDAEGESWRGW